MFFQGFCGVLSRIVILCALHTHWRFFILLQRGIAIFDCEAAALPGRFLPELGRSSERPFFLRGSFGLWVRRAFARGRLSPRRSALLPSDQNPSRKNGAKVRCSRRLATPQNLWGKMELDALGLALLSGGGALGLKRGDLRLVAAGH